MSKLENLRPNASVKGILPNCLVAVVNVQWFGTEPTEITYKEPSRKLSNQILYRHDEPRIEVAKHSRSGNFDGNSHFFGHVSEPHSVRIIHPKFILGAQR